MVGELRLSLPRPLTNGGGASLSEKLLLEHATDDLGEGHVDDVTTSFDSAKTARGLVDKHESQVRVSDANDVWRGVEDGRALRELFGCVQVGSDVEDCADRALGQRPWPLVVEAGGGTS